MKKSIFALMAATLLAITFISCNDAETKLRLQDSNTLSISFAADSDPAPRAFFDNTATAESWEKTLNTVTIFLYDSGNDLVVRREMSAAEVSAKRVSFSLPNTVLNTMCAVYAVANYAVTGDMSTEANLKAALENSPGSYNGTFATVSTSAARSGGFVMSGSGSVAVQPSPAENSCAITLKRTVAKVALQIGVDANFSANHGGGAIKINSAVLNNAASQTPVIAGTANTGSLNYTYTQSTNESSGKFQNLFYCYESPQRTGAEDKATITINGIYDRDGNFSTTNDQTDVEYKIVINTAGNNQITRNGYYRISATVTGLDGTDLVMESTITVSDWETPITQDVVLGM